MELIRNILLVLLMCQNAVQLLGQDFNLREGYQIEFTTNDLRATFYTIKENKMIGLVLKKPIKSGNDTLINIGAQAAGEISIDKKDPRNKRVLIRVKWVKSVDDQYINLDCTPVSCSEDALKQAKAEFKLEVTGMVKTAIFVKPKARLALTFCENSTPLPPRRLALIIGNNYSGQDSLSNAINDANGAGEEFKKWGFDTLTQRNLDMLGILDVLSAFKDSLDSKNYDVGLIYFSGHGLQQNGVTYLVPMGANLSKEHYVKKQCIELELFIEHLSAAPIGIVVLDACRNNNFTKPKKIQTGTEPIKISNTNKSKELLVAYATHPSGAAYDKHPSRANGLFTGTFLEKCQNQAAIKLLDLFSEIGSAVKTAIDVQRPETLQSCKNYCITRTK